MIDSGRDTAVSGVAAEGSASALLPLPLLLLREGQDHHYQQQELEVLLAQMDQAVQEQHHWNVSAPTLQGMDTCPVQFVHAIQICCSLHCTGSIHVIQNFGKNRSPREIAGLQTRQHGLSKACFTGSVSDVINYLPRNRLSNSQSSHQPKDQKIKMKLDILWSASNSEATHGPPRPGKRRKFFVRMATCTRCSSFCCAWLCMDHKETEMHCLKTAEGCLSCDCPEDTFDSGTR